MSIESEEMVCIQDGWRSFEMARLRVKRWHVSKMGGDHSK